MLKSRLFYLKIRKFAATHKECKALLNKQYYFLISAKEAFDKWNIEFHEFTEQFKADLYVVKAEHPIVAMLKFLERISKCIFISENNADFQVSFRKRRTRYDTAGSGLPGGT